MARQILIVLDKPPLETDPWADAVFRDADLQPVDNTAISKAMSHDPESLKALLANSGQPVGPVDELAGYYRKALQQRYGEHARLGLYGTAWLSYVERVDACVIDWSEVEKRGSAPGVPEGDGLAFRRQSREFIHERTEKFVAPERLLELEPGVAPDAKVAQTLAFLRGLGVA